MLIKKGFKMDKKTLMAVGMFVVGASPLAYAHAPTEIEIKYDSASKMLTAKMDHAVQARTEHFIDKLYLKVNGERIIEQSFVMQEKKDVQSVKYYLPDLKMGDNIVLEAYCNKSGKRGKSYIVKQN